MAMPHSSELVSRKAAAELLSVHTLTVDKIAERNGLRVRQIPGHKRKFYYRAELESLLARAEVVATTEARG